MRARWWSLACLLVLAGSGLAGAEDPPKHEAVESARDETVRELRALAEWARKKRALGFREKVYEAILHLRPDHKVARNMLGFKRTSRDGPWVRKSTYKTRKDRDPSAAREGQTRLDTVLAAYRDQVLDVIGGLPDTGAEAKALLQHLEALLPNDRMLRAFLGHTEFEGRWVLPETKSGTLRRRKLRALGETERERFAGLVRPVEGELKSKWESGSQSDRYAVVGTVDSGITRSGCILMDVAESVCDEILGTTNRRRGRAVTIILKGRGDALKHAHQNEAWRPKIPDIERLGGLTLPTGERLAFAEDPDRSRMSCPRQVISIGLKRRFKHRRGWITEGVGQRFCWYAAGQHGPAYVNTKQTSKERARGEVSVPESPDDWMKAAAEVLEKRGPAILASVLTRNLNAMRGEDVLVAYGLAAYLIEARPDKFAPFLEASAKRHDVEAFTRETLGVANLGVFTARLQRWLAEYRAK